MNQLQDKIKELADEDIIRLTIWVFDEIRKKNEGIFADFIIKELKSEDLIKKFNAFLNEMQVEPIKRKPDNKIIVETFRIILLEISQNEYKIVEEAMEELGLEAGGFDLTTYLMSLDFSYIILIILVLCSSVRYKRIKVIEDKKANTSEKSSFEIEINPSNLKDIIKKLPFIDNESNDNKK